MSASEGFGIRRDQRERAHDLAGLAEAARGDVLVDPRLLDRVQLVAAREPLDRDDRLVADGADRGAALPATGSGSMPWRMHRRFAWPLTWLVHAPHTPTPQPYFGPVTPSRSRRTQSSGMSAGTSGVVRGTPFTFRL